MEQKEVKNLSFEQAMQELEAIVEKMEDGTLSLEESVQAYARGTELAKFCRGKLNAAEATIRKLESDGSLTPYLDDKETPF